MPRPPRIGFTLSCSLAEWGLWRPRPAMVASWEYAEAIQRAGALIRPIVVDPRLVDHPGLALDDVDALLLPGGMDLDPHRYGEDPHPETQVPDALRDDVELSLVMAALDRDLPVLAVCRGLQVLNVARGGRLCQHLPDVLGTELHRQRLNTMEGCWHEAVAVPGTRLAEVVGTDPLPVVSHHHQGVARVGDRLTVSARAADGVVEGLEDPDHRFALAVQWHPEMDPADRLIPALARAASARGRVRRPAAPRLASG